MPATEMNEWSESERFELSSAIRTLRLQLLNDCFTSPLLILIADLLSTGEFQTIIDWTENPSEFCILDRNGLVRLWEARIKEKRSFNALVCNLKIVCKQRVPTMCGGEIRLLSRSDTGVYRLFPDSDPDELPPVCPIFLQKRRKARTKKGKARKPAPARRAPSNIMDPLFSPTYYADYMSVQYQQTSFNSSLYYCVECPRCGEVSSSASNSFVSESSYTDVLPQLSADDVDEVLFEVEHPEEKPSLFTAPDETPQYIAPAPCYRENQCWDYYNDYYVMDFDCTSY
ncbi:hypothetical protein Q1695_009538 [Nippostrongylus brasiliensis]|nr:hypothetical protein Q1695_009538 [Nippostrongylus brasiliensis]